jgi:hypothetical protein
MKNGFFTEFFQTVMFLLTGLMPIRLYSVIEWTTTYRPAVRWFSPLSWKPFQ